MHKDFWLERWDREEIGFHEGAVNAHLNQFWKMMNLNQAARVFVPLCGKSVDMQWLREQGHPVVGVELSRIAVQAFFKENNYLPGHFTSGKFDHYEANDIQLLCGDFFDTSKADLIDVEAVYDRASMVALPPDMRERYVKHLQSILQPGVKILLVAFDYTQSEMQGPPFGISTAEVERLYSDIADIRLLAEIDVLAENPRFQKKGLTRLYENIYELKLR